MKQLLKLISFIILLIPVGLNAQGVFFSEYIEGSSNNKAIEIYNGTDATIDLSNYEIVQGVNGATFEAAGDDAKVTLSGSLASGEVYVVANGDADATILAAADITYVFNQSRIASFNGDDALGLFENDVLIDVFGEPGVDPSAGSWPVAGDGATREFTLVRKGSITSGNVTPLGSFGTNAEDSEWIVNPQNDFSFIGFHTLDGEVNPLINPDLDGFIGNFGLIAFPTVSPSQSYKVTGSDLTEDLIITPPAGFEISLTDDFTGTIGTSASPITISPTDGAIAETTIYVQFKPAAADGADYVGDIVHTSAGADDKSILVTGKEGVLTNDLFISQYVEGSSSNKAVEIFNNSGAEVDLSNYELAIYFNGSSSISTSLTLSDVVATLGNGEAIAVCNSSSAEALLALATSTTSSVVNFNGDDALAIIKDGIIIDVFGQIGADPGTSWEVGGPTGGSTANNTLVRKATVQIGNTIGLASFGTSPDDSEWEVLAIDDFTGIGTHAVQQEGAPQIIIDQANFMSAFGQVKAGEVSMSSSYTVEGINLIGDITVTAPDGFTVATGTVAAGSTLTLSPTDGVLAATTIEVVFAPAEVLSFTGQITHESMDAIAQSVAVSGVGLDVNAIFFEDFTGCDALNQFTAFSVTGEQEWGCTSGGESGDGARMSGFASGAQINEDWLITPAIDLSMVAERAAFSFDSDVRFDGPAMEVLVSSDFDGDVAAATWELVIATLDTDADNGNTWTNSGDLFVDDYIGGDLFIGFKYTSDPTNGAAQWIIDNVSVVAVEFSPAFEVDFAGFNGDFGLQDEQTLSPSASFSILGIKLTADVTVTPPIGFQVATDAAFTSIGTAAAPLTIAPVDEDVDATVFVRFAPETDGSFSGNVIVATEGYDPETIAVSGVGASVLSNSVTSTFRVFPNPTASVFEINSSEEISTVKLINLSGIEVKSYGKVSSIDISDLSSGVYILDIANKEGVSIFNTRIIKQ